MKKLWMLVPMGFETFFKGMLLKSFLRILFLLFSTSLTIAQTPKKINSLVLKGRIINLQKKYIYFSYKDERYDIISDTIKVNNEGFFYYKANSVVRPQRTTIYMDEFEASDVFIAPGFNLDIIADVRDQSTFSKSKLIGGLDWGSNSYRRMIDSITNYEGKKNIYELKEEAFLHYLNTSLKRNDSIGFRIFTNKHKESFAKEFAKIVQFDNYIAKLYFLTYYATSKNVNPDSASLFLTKHINLSQYPSLFNDEFLISDIYRLLMTGNYLSYLVVKNKKYNIGVNGLDLRLQIVNKYYKGKVKDFVLQHLFQMQIEYCESYEKLKTLEDRAAACWKNNLDNKTLLAINKLIVAKSLLISETQIGKLAPDFELRSHEDKTYSLADFIGKVVYLDLWASWCAPCRKEIPYLQNIVNSYKSSANIVFLSIAVKDNETDWKKALRDDRPQWLQLIDKDDRVFQAYNAYSIPRYIIIDKEGKIVTFDAPRPSSLQELKKILKVEIERIVPHDNTMY